MPYVCEYCNYSTNKKSNLKIHFTSNKHKDAVKHIENHKDEIKKVSSVKNNHVCNDCGKEHKDSQSLYNHRRRACEKNEKTKIYKLNKENERIKKENEKLKKEKYMMVENYKPTTNIDNSVNNSVDNSINISIQLNGYSETDTSHLTDNNYISIITNVVKFFELVHANPDKPENMNLSLTNLQDAYMNVYENNRWSRVKKNEQLEKLISNLYDKVEEWIINNKERLSSQMIKQWRRFYENIVEYEDRRKNAKDNLATELYNNRKLISDNKNNIENRCKHKSNPIRVI